MAVSNVEVMLRDRTMPKRAASPEPGRPTCGELCGIIVAGAHRWGENVLDRFGCRSLLPVALRPLIEHSIDWLSHTGLVDVWICANSETSAIQATLKAPNDWNVSFRFFEDIMPRGPAGCVRDAALQTTANTFVVIEGSVVADFDLQGLLETHRRENAALSIAVEGQSEVSGRPADVPVGVYVFSRSVFSAVPAKGYQDLNEVLIPRLYEGGRRIAVHVIRHGSATRVMNPSSYLEANLRAASRLAAQRHAFDGFERVGDAWVHRTAVVAPTARLKGAVLIDRNTHIDTDAMVVGPAVVGAGGKIRTGAVVSRSVFWKSCTVGRGVIVDHSLLTDGSRVETTDVLRESVVCSRDSGVL